MNHGFIYAIMATVNIVHGQIRVAQGRIYDLNLMSLCYFDADTDRYFVNIHINNLCMNSSKTSQKRRRAHVSIGLFTLVVSFCYFCWFIESFFLLFSFRNKLSNVYELITKRLCARLTIACAYISYTGWNCVYGYTVSLHDAHAYAYDDDKHALNDWRTEEEMHVCSASSVASMHIRWNILEMVM